MRGNFGRGHRKLRAVHRSFYDGRVGRRIRHRGAQKLRLACTLIAGDATASFAKAHFAGAVIDHVPELVSSDLAVIENSWFQNRLRLALPQTCNLVLRGGNDLRL